jgi:hypothetical protein
VASYVLFSPYADTLGGRLAFSAAGFPGLFALLGTATQGQPLGMVPINFVRMAVPTLIVVALLH